jgi:hypothetical protein
LNGWSRPTNSETPGCPRSKAIHYSKICAATQDTPNFSRKCAYPLKDEEQRPLFASPRPREATLQERTPQPPLQPGNSADSSCFILISCLSHSRNSFPIFRKDSFGFRDQLSHKFGCVGRMAKTCVLFRVLAEPKPPHPLSASTVSSG